MDKKLVKALNEQVKNELYSAYLYLSMAMYFESENLSGFSHWMRVQFQEEQSHAMKIIEFLNDRGQKVVLGAIDAPPKDFDSPLDVFEKTLLHEKKVTAMINKLYDLAEEVNDKAAVVFLQWFITEQVEEEKNDEEIIGYLKKIGPSTGALFMLDRSLAKRGAE